MQQILSFDSGEKRPRKQPSIIKFRNIDSVELELAFSILDAYRIKISHAYDKLSSLSNSRTRLLPHQIEATHRVANAVTPRFILADEVGLGKTIEAGLILKELMFRRGFSRVLVCTPAPLSIQWQQEMKNKFNDEFEILNRKTFYQYASNWAAHPKLLTSIDFIKNPKYGDEILKRKWDIVVFDEAHRLRRDYSKVTKAYAFADAIAEHCEAMLLLTATPFRGKLEELFYLVRLIDPHLLGPYHSFVQEYLQTERSENSMTSLRDKISRVMLRRRKVEVGGFTKRFCRTVKFDLSEKERLLYDETTEYIKREYNLSMQQKNRAVGFIMIVFQKLLDSSTAALLRALEKRKTMLEQRLYGPSPALEIEYDFEEIDDMESPEDLISEQDDRKRTLKELRREILTLNRLVSIGRSIEGDRKLVKLKETIQLLKREGHKKFVMFTQFRTTQDYLYENLKEYKVSLFHGSLNMQKKEDAIEEFRNETEILICTEAGGEGRNLQFASILFNYDLPWSPLKVEQRAGRIHRFGQKVDVKIINFSTRDTVAERILQVLEEKINLFEQSIGPSDALLGVVEDEFDFQSSVMQFVAGKKTRKELNQELESKIKIAESAYSKLNDLVTPQCVDFNLQDYYDHTREDRAIENEEIEKLTLSYLRLNQDDEFELVRRTGRGKNKDLGDYILKFKDTGVEKAGTFNSDLALANDKLEFLAVGHRLIDRALEFFLSHPDKNTIGEIPRLPGMQAGHYVICLCHFLGGLSRAELLSCMLPEDKNKRPFIPEEILIPAGYRSQEFSGNRTRASAPTNESAGVKTFTERNIKEDPMLDRAVKLLQKEGEERAHKLKDRLHTIFKKEEYTKEISYGKKIRRLEEKLDRQKMRYRTDPRTAFQAAVTRTENELLRARQERETALNKIRMESNIEVRLEILQIFKVK